jgi:hypothetical protein
MMQTQRILELDTDVTLVEGGRNALAPEEGLRVVRSWPGVYAARPPWRLLLVLPPGLEPDALPRGGCCEAEVAWVRGEGGKRYRQITVTRLLPAPPADAARSQLTALIASAPRSDRPGGARGDVGPRPLVPGDLTEAHSVTLPGATWRLLEQLGGGNRSAGIRQLALGAPALPAAADQVEHLRLAADLIARQPDLDWLAAELRSLAARLAAPLPDETVAPTDAP